MRQLILTAALVVAVTAPAWGEEQHSNSAHQHGDLFTTYVEVDKLERRIRDGRDGTAWAAQAWFGGDRERVWLKTEGEVTDGQSPEHAEVQALYSWLWGDFFDVQVGLRQDFRPRPERTHAVLGLQGLAPHWFEVDAALFLSHKGELSARAEVEYDILLTQRLILQPAVEVNASASRVEEREIGAGLTSIGTGLRLRYEIVPEVAPYIGVTWDRKLGETANLARRDGEDVDETALVTGIKFWF